MSDDDVPRERGRWVKGHGNPAASWKKGQSVSPGGLYGSLALQRELEGKDGRRVLQKLFRRKSVAIMHALTRIVLDPSTPATVRVSAAQLFLEHGWGKSPVAEGKPSKMGKERPVVVVTSVPRKNDSA